jgi:hypothetical protein
VFDRAAGAVAPGGTLLVVGHDITNPERGWGGPQDRGVLYGPEDVSAGPDGLDIVRAQRANVRWPPPKATRSPSMPCCAPLERRVATVSLPVPVPLVGDELEVPCLDGSHRRYLNLDGAASTNALAAVASRVHDFLPWYSIVHRGGGYKSRAATDATGMLAPPSSDSQGAPSWAPTWRSSAATRPGPSTSRLRLRVSPDDVVVTTVIEHHANLLPWARIASRRFVECASDGTFTADDLTVALDGVPRPKLLAITGAQCHRLDASRR